MPGTPVPGMFLLVEAWQSGLTRATYNRLIGSHLSRKHPIRRSESYRLLPTQPKDQVQESIRCSEESQAHKRPLAVKTTLFTSPILLRYQTSEYPCSPEHNTNYKNNNNYFFTCLCQEHLRNGEVIHSREGQKRSCLVHPDASASLVEQPCGIFVGDWRRNVDRCDGR